MGSAGGGAAAAAEYCHVAALAAYVFFAPHRWQAFFVVLCCEHNEQCQPPLCHAAITVAAQRGGGEPGTDGGYLGPGGLETCAKDTEVPDEAEREVDASELEEVADEVP